MSANHTPGPWTNHGCYIYRVGTDGKRTGPAIANTRVDEFVTPEEEQHNARLIAAAPDLLEAIKKCAAVCAGETTHKNGLIEALESARAALGKAGAA